MIDVSTLFFFIGIIVFSGFLGTLFFNKTKFSDFVILMFFGLLAGPVFGIVGAPSIEFLRNVAPFFASLALVILLFEGGLQLNFYRVLKELPKATAFTFMVFCLSIAIVSGILIAFGWNPLLAALVGCILGGTSSAIIVPLVNRAAVMEETKTFLTIESALTDTLCVISTIAVAEIMLAKSTGLQQIFQSILAGFSIAAVLGFIFAVIWLKLSRDFKEIKQYDYILTLGALFILYSITEFAKGNGAFSALIFGIVLGNAKEFGQILKMERIGLDASISVFQAEISLFVRTFFFVYLGLIFNTNFFSIDLMLIAIMLAFALFIARHIGVMILLKFSKEFSADSGAIRALMARGLAAAVLATYPISIGITDQNAKTILQVAFLVILFSNIITTMGIFHFERSIQKSAPFANAAGP